METVNQMACPVCYQIGKFKLIEPANSPNAKGFAKAGFQNFSESR